MSPARRGSGEGSGTPKRKPAARKKPAAPRKPAARKPSGGRKRTSPPAAVAEPAVGSTLGSYLIEAPIGRGGMGVLFRASDQRAATKGRRVALKVLSPSLAADDRFRRRFERESQMAASLDHPNIVPVFEAGEDAGVLYIAMRYVEGEDLHGYLERTGPLDPTAAIALLAQVGSALDAAHAHALVHRDVKPANILVVGAEGAGGPHVYLTDFGVTKHTDSRSGLTATGQFVGTVEYVAPEQIEGRQVDGRADVYSLGCVMFECLTGSPPFAGERDAATMWAHLSEPPPSASGRRPDLPAAVDVVIERALAKSPDDRYATCGEMMNAARTAVSASGPGAAAPGRAVPPPAPPPAPPPSPPAGTPVQPSPPSGYPVGTPTPPAGRPAPPAGYPAPYPGPRRTGPPVGVILAIVGAVVAVGVLLTVVLTMGGDDPPPDGPVTDGPTTVAPDTGPFPTAAEQELLGHIPQDLQQPPCERATEPVPGAAASVECFTDTEQLLDYALFRDAGSMNAAYQQQVVSSGVTSETGDCASGQPAEDSWLDPGGAESGRLLCFTNDVGSAAIAWTHDELLILGEASRPIGDAVALYEFWTSIADHTTTAQP